MNDYLSTAFQCPECRRLFSAEGGLIDYCSECKEKIEKLKKSQKKTKFYEIKRMAWELFIAEFKNFICKPENPDNIELNHGDDYCDVRLKFENCFYLAEKFYNFAKERQEEKPDDRYEIPF
jgi:hypothetical protein